MYLEEIIEGVALENSRLECKSRLNRSDVLGWLKTVAGFANASGGDFFIGVEDKTNKLIGFTKTEADSERNYFNNIVNEHLSPCPPLMITFPTYKIRETERFLIRITVKESPVKPVILKYDGVPAIFMRREGFTNGASYEEIIAMSLKSSRQQYDTIGTETQFDSSKFTSLWRYYKENNNGKELKEKALQSLGFMNPEGKMTQGALLFEDNYEGPKTAVQCSVFSGINKGSQRIVNVSKFQGNIISTINYMYEFVLQRMNHSIVKHPNYRETIDAYPRRALFEGIINAVAHRDYYLDGTQIQLDMFRDRLEISSPGSFYMGECFVKTYDLSNIISKRRNEVISGVLVMCNVMEAAGTGFDKITEEYANADETHKPFIYSASDHFTLVLPDLTYTVGVEGGGVGALRYPPIFGASDYDEKILAFCYSKPRKAAEIAEYLGLSDSSYFRKNILENLFNQHYLLKSKISRASAYVTNRELVELE